MPVKNAGRYLQACLESIAQQSYKNWELIAIDDHSSDSSLELLNQFCVESNGKVFTSNGKGIISALQTGYKHVSGKFIHRMDADDVMPLNKLELLMRHWAPRSVVTGKVSYFSDEWLVGLGFQNYQTWLNGLGKEENFWCDVYRECPIASPAWLMSIEDFESVGGFDNHKIPEDYDLAFRIYKAKLSVTHISEIVHLWRDSQNRTSRKDPSYFPIAYHPLKVDYFKEVDYDNSKELVLWGAGKKGKLIAKLLIQQGLPFTWVTNNMNKVRIKIQGKSLMHEDDLSFKNQQFILATASQEDRMAIESKLLKNKKVKGLDYWWFC